MLRRQLLADLVALVAVLAPIRGVLVVLHRQRDRAMLAAVLLDTQPHIEGAAVVEQVLLALTEEVVMALAAQDQLHRLRVRA